MLLTRPAQLHRDQLLHRVQVSPVVTVGPVFDRPIFACSTRCGTLASSPVSCEVVYEEL